MDDVLDCVRLIHVRRNIHRYIFQFLVRVYEFNSRIISVKIWVTFSTNLYLRRGTRNFNLFSYRRCFDCLLRLEGSHKFFSVPLCMKFACAQPLSEFGTIIKDTITFRLVSLYGVVLVFYFTRFHIKFFCLSFILNAIFFSFSLWAFFMSVNNVNMNYRFPFYYELKIILVFWLLSPVTRGSSIMYRRVIHPLFMRREQVCSHFGFQFVQIQSSLLNCLSQEN